MKTDQAPAVRAILREIALEVMKAFTDITGVAPDRRAMLDMEGLTPEVRCAALIHIEGDAAYLDCPTVGGCATCRDLAEQYEDMVQLDFWLDEIRAR